MYYKTNICHTRAVLKELGTFSIPINYKGIILFVVSDLNFQSCDEANKSNCSRVSSDAYGRNVV